jgi:Flp pilus assembly protein TadD
MDGKTLNPVRLWPAGRAILFAASLGLCGCAQPPTGGTASAAPSDGRPAQGDVNSTLRLARAARAAGDLPSAVNLYRSALARQPGKDAVAVELGDTLIEADAVDDAVAAYGRVPPASEARLGALLGLMRAQLSLSSPAKALDYADQALSLASQDRRAIVGRGVALDLLGRHAEAQASYRAVLATAPQDLAARNDLALSLALSGAFAEALDILKPLAQSSAATPRTRQNLALIYGLMGDNERAAALSRVDLDEPTTETNLRFFALVRGERP